jgi:hypothetical protein
VGVQKGSSLLQDEDRKVGKYFGREERGRIPDGRNRIHKDPASGWGLVGSGKLLSVF